jgi:hypothetical protein
VEATLRFSGGRLPAFIAASSFVRSPLAIGGFSDGATSPGGALVSTIPGWTGMADPYISIGGGEPGPLSDHDWPLQGQQSDGFGCRPLVPTYLTKSEGGKAARSVVRASNRWLGSGARESH